MACGSEAGAAHQADPEPPNQDDSRQRGHEVGLHRPLGALAVPFAQQRAPLLVGTQADDGRGINGMDRPPLPPQAYGLDGQALQTPPQGPVEQHLQRHLAALHRAFDPVPAPAQMDDVGQGGAGQTSPVVNESASKHSDQHDANKVRGACGQPRKQAIDRTRRQVYWRGAARGWDEWDGLDIHPPLQISYRFGYSFGKTRNI